MTKDQLVREAAQSLATKLREIAECSEFKTVFTLAMIHGQAYQGKTYKAELERLQHVLRMPE